MKTLRVALHEALEAEAQTLGNSLVFACDAAADALAQTFGVEHVLSATGAVAVVPLRVPATAPPSKNAVFLTGKAVVCASFTPCGHIGHC